MTDNTAPSTAPATPSVVASVPAAVKPVVQQAPVVTPAAVIAAGAAVKESIKETVKPAGVLGAYANEIAKLGMIAQMRLEHISEYVVAMAPNKPMKAETGAMWQKRFLTNVVALINDPTDFPTTFGILIRIIADNKKGCFSLTNAARFAEVLPGTTQDREGFRRIINMLLVIASTADSGQAALKQLNLTFSTQYLITQAGRESIQAWLG